MAPRANRQARSSPAGVATPKTILAAVAEPEARSQPVIERAAQIAALFDAELLLFHSAFDSALSGGPFFDSARLARSRGWRLDEAGRALERHVRRLQSQGTPTQTLSVWEEPAPHSIMRAAVRTGADLIVAGPHERSRRGGPFPLRQTDWQLLSLCAQPLLLVRAGAPRRGPVLAALDPFHANDKPAALDRRLASWAATLSGALHEPLYAAHTISPARYAPDESDASRSRRRERAERALKRLLDEEDAPYTRTYVIEGPPERTLPQLAQRLAAQVLVMGAVSRRGLQRFAVGNTAERLIHSSPCDLLVVKPEGFRSRLGRVTRQHVIRSTPGKKPDSRAAR
jgi:universal stress protein E